MTTADIAKLLIAIAAQCERRERMELALMEIERLVENFATDFHIKLSEQTQKTR